MASRTANAPGRTPRWRLGIAGGGQNVGAGTSTRSISTAISTYEKPTGRRGNWEGGRHARAPPSAAPSTPRGGTGSPGPFSPPDLRRRAVKARRLLRAGTSGVPPPPAPAFPPRGRHPGGRGEPPRARDGRPGPPGYVAREMWMEGRILLRDQWSRPIPRTVFTNLPVDARRVSWHILTEHDTGQPPPGRLWPDRRVTRDCGGGSRDDLPRP